MTGRVSLNLHHRTEEIILLPAKQEHFFCVWKALSPPQHQAKIVRNEQTCPSASLSYWPLFCDIKSKDLLDLATFLINLFICLLVLHQGQSFPPLLSVQSLPTSSLCPCSPVLPFSPPFLFRKG